MAKSAEYMFKFAAPAMIESPYEWTVLEMDEKPQNKQTNLFVNLLLRNTHSLIALRSITDTLNFAVSKYIESNTINVSPRHFW